MKLFLGVWFFFSCSSLYLPSQAHEYHECRISSRTHAASAPAPAPPRASRKWRTACCAALRCFAAAAVSGCLSPSLGPAPRRRGRGSGARGWMKGDGFHLERRVPYDGSFCKGVGPRPLVFSSVLGDRWSALGPTRVVLVVLLGPMNLPVVYGLERCL